MIDGYLAFIIMKLNSKVKQLSDFSCLNNFDRR